MLRGDPSLTQTDTTHHIRARFLTRSFARIRATHTTSNAAHKGNPDEAEPSRGVTRAKKVHTSVTDTAGSPGTGSAGDGARGAATRLPASRVAHLNDGQRQRIRRVTEQCLPRWPTRSAAIAVTPRPIPSSWTLRAGVAGRWIPGTNGRSALNRLNVRSCSDVAFPRSINRACQRFLVRATNHGDRAVRAVEHSVAD